MKECKVAHDKKCKVAQILFIVLDIVSYKRLSDIKQISEMYVFMFVNKLTPSQNLQHLMGPS